MCQTWCQALDIKNDQSTFETQRTEKKRRQCRTNDQQNNRRKFQRFLVSGISECPGTRKNKINIMIPQHEILEHHK